MNSSERQRSTQVLYLAAFTVATVTLWVGFEVIRALTKPTKVPEVPSQLLMPISSVFNPDGLASVRSRLPLNQADLDAVGAGVSKEATSSGNF